MAKCNYCGTTILLGGKTDANGRFCNATCQGRGGLLALSRKIPETRVQEEIWKVHQGACPKCNGSGPVDVYTSHKVWAALVLTQWSSTPQVSCRACGVKSQIGGTLFSLVLGWWAVHGLLMTPVQIGRNIAGMVSPPDATKPSPKLENVIRMTMAARAVEQSQQAAAAKV
jgi:hypothetical protein